nr:hypothetical protein [Tanacetum cinerariifolium]
MIGIGDFRFFRVLRINCFKMENLIIDEKAILVDNEGKPLRKVDDDSEDDVARVDNKMASFFMEILEMLQAFCDNLDIKVKGRQKK